jgi:hypothetical protein
MPKSRSKLRDAILSAKDYNSIPYEIPEWGVTVNIRGFTVNQAVAFEKSKIGVDENMIHGLYVAFCLYDDDGERIFDPVEDLESLCDKNQDVTIRLFKACLAFNQGAKGADEEAEKNS